MKNKFSLLLVALVVLGFVACTKSNNSTAINPNPNITVNGTSTNLTGISKAFYASKIFNDTLVIVNSSVTDSSVINNLSNKPNIASSANFLLLTVINSKNTVTQGTTYSSSANVSTYFQVNSIQYKSFPLLPTSIRIDTLNNIFVSGSYSSTVVNNTNLLDLSNPVISGRFKAYF